MPSRGEGRTLTHSDAIRHAQSETRSRTQVHSEQRTAVSDAIRPLRCTQSHSEQLTAVPGSSQQLRRGWGWLHLHPRVE
jgi:hypothetical protein